MDNEMFVDLARTSIDEGQQRLAYVTKTLLYRTSPSIFERLDFYDDEVFLEPLLFAFFNSKEPPLKLDQILFGYTQEELKPKSLSLYLDENGIAYLPNIGYVVSSKRKETVKSTWDKTSKIPRVVHDGRSVPIVFEDITKAEGTPIEVCRYNNPLLAPSFVDGEGNVLDARVTDSTHKHAGHLGSALETLRVHYKRYYNLIVAVTKKIVIFNNDRLNSFAALPAHGIAFLNATEDSDEVFFIEDILHQCGHVIFSAMTFDKEQYFGVDPETPLKLFTGGEGETRSVYVTLHGLFTEAAMGQGLNICHELGLFTGDQDHELAGRLAFILKRFGVDLNNLSYEGLFTEKGRSLYDEFRRTFEELLRKRRDLIEHFDLSNQDYNFSYKKFRDLNPLSSYIRDVARA